MENNTVNWQLLRGCAEGNVNGVKGALQNGADVNMRNYDGRTPLHLAATEDQEETARLLLRNGADTDVRDRYDKTPVDDARRSGNYSMVVVLSRYGADVEKETVKGIENMGHCRSRSNLEPLQVLQ
mmetsp:Transcript_3071/g.9371  ORF Transcript_3071/g.9371 Transcript_3071/m.9371 type:complete len:126 (+) Transcript_3071:69-446(+)|eukprot:CAMPEP_0198723916 /NCGR_PEP_ID=MMETSP1475-20131203/1429_1 /TAXON_ID= ORGANISM="Unidentified sp., Strain CCMP1999" /NCGR_SAMPLE_ID=MMETSP1475 /ASSEMBLY_ACC=CAM_ASM_001111 /LENGTH=125 /DNA_ID=CAMNT_0044485247 /DNA_START=22 /DNA_END=399 /DNA_ORIENTATION=-